MTSNVLPYLMFSHTPFLSQGRTRGTILLTVTSMLHIVIAGMDSVTQQVTFGRPRPAGNGRVHDLSPAVTGQLVKTGHQTWRTVATVTRLLTPV